MLVESKGMLFDLLGTCLAEVQEERPFSIGLVAVEAKVSSPSSLELVHKVQTSDRMEQKNKIWHEVEKRQDDLFAIQKELAKVSGQSEENGNDEELGIEYARLCAIKGQHVRRVKHLSNLPIAYTVTTKTERFTLRAGIVARLPWHPKPVVWCPHLPRETVVEHTAKVDNDHRQDVIYVMGGGHGGRTRGVEVYDCKYDTWSDLPTPMAIPRHGHVAAVLGDSICVFGGYNAGVPVERYDTDKARWHPACPEATIAALGIDEIDCAAVAVMNDQLYLTGGAYGHCIRSIRSMASIFQGSNMQRCFTIKSMNRPRWGHTLTPVLGALFAVGGENLSGVLDSIERYQENKGKGGKEDELEQWIEMAKMPRPRAMHAAAELEGKLWVMGGTELPFGPDARHAPLATVDIFDPLTNSWAAGPPLRLERRALRAVNAGGRLYVIGGFDRFGLAMPSVERLSACGKHWEFVAPMGLARGWHAAVAFSRVP